MADKTPEAAGNGPMLIRPSTWEALRRRVEENELSADPKDFDVTTRGGKKFLRLRRIPGSPRPGPPPIPAFTLSAGKDGARVYKGVLEWCVTSLEFEKMGKVNSFTGQAAIKGVEVMKRKGEESSGEEEEDDDGWWDFDWWGDVWAKVVLDPETGEPASWDIVGPDKPEMLSIPALDEDLSRETSEGGGEGESETGYAILLGNVPEDGRITQERTGNLEWFCAFVPEGSGSSGPSSDDDSDSSSDDSSDSSNASSTDSQSEKSSNAIVAMPWHESGYGAMATIESNEVLFEFIVRGLRMKGRRMNVRIDRRFLSICDRHSFTVSAQGSAPFPVGAEVAGDMVILRALPFLSPGKITLRLTGVRKGFARWNMPPRTARQKAQAEASNLAQYERTPGQL